MGLAVFVGDKLVGELNNIETLCHMIVSNILENATITIQNPYDYNHRISMHINLEKDTNCDVKIVNGYPYITCDVSISGYVLSMSDTLDLSSEETLRTINESVNSYLEYCIESYLYKTAKDFGADIDNFGSHILHKYLTSNEWNNSDWLNNYKNSFFDVNVKSNIVSGYLFNKF